MAGIVSFLIGTTSLFIATRNTVLRLKLSCASTTSCKPVDIPNKTPKGIWNFIIIALIIIIYFPITMNTTTTATTILIPIHNPIPATMNNHPLRRISHNQKKTNHMAPILSHMTLRLPTTTNTIKLWKKKRTIKQSYLYNVISNMSKSNKVANMHFERRMPIKPFLKGNVFTTNFPSINITSSNMFLF